MSNLSNIGFPVSGEEDVNRVLMEVLPHIKQIPAPPEGAYYMFDDESGAQLFLQANAIQDLIGFNPAFRGTTKFQVYKAEFFERDTSELDGCCRAWGKATEFPIVFDIPDYAAAKLDQTEFDVGVTAFASNDFEYYETEKDYYADINPELRYPPGDFSPTFLFGKTAEGEPPQAHAGLTGVVRDLELCTNSLTGSEFYHFLITAHGVDFDIVADPKLFSVTPKNGKFIRGNFWLSGKIIDGQD